MQLLKYFPLLWLFAPNVCLSAPTLLGDQVVFNYGDTPPHNGVEQVLSKTSLHHRMVFDKIKFEEDEATKHLDYLFPWNFTNFEAMNVSAAIEQNLLAENDTDCAMPDSNTAILTSKTRYPTASRFDLDTKVPIKHNLSKSLDLKGITLKPIGPAPPGVIALINAWRIHNGKVLYKYSAGTRWGNGGFLKPIQADFSRFWPGWGNGVNMVEIEAKGPDGRQWQVCIGRIEFELVEKGEDRVEGPGEV